jgi:hypothetical protein
MQSVETKSSIMKGITIKEKSFILIIAQFMMKYQNSKKFLLAGRKVMYLLFRGPYYRENLVVLDKIVE